MYFGFSYFGHVKKLIVRFVVRGGDVFPLSLR